MRLFALTALTVIICQMCFDLWANMLWVRKVSGNCLDFGGCWIRDGTREG